MGYKIKLRMSVMREEDEAAASSKFHTPESNTPDTELSAVKTIKLVSKSFRAPMTPPASPKIVDKAEFEDKPRPINEPELTSNPKPTDKSQPASKPKPANKSKPAVAIRRSNREPHLKGCSRPSNRVDKPLPKGREMYLPNTGKREIVTLALSPCDSPGMKKALAADIAAIFGGAVPVRNGKGK